MTGNDDNWKNDLKSIVSAVVSDYNPITIGDDQRSYIIEKLKELLEPYKIEGEIPEYISDTYARLIESIFKFIKAIACSNLRIGATSEDVDEALHFIKYKLDFLSQFYREDEKSISIFENDRQIKIHSIFKGQEVTIKGVTERIQAEGINCSLKTISRDIKYFGQEGHAKKVKHSVWKIL